MNIKVPVARPPASLIGIPKYRGKIIAVENRVKYKADRIAGKLNISMAPGASKLVNFK